MGHEFERVTRRVPERLGQDSRYWLDCSKAQRELGWAPEVPWEQGVRQAVQWYRDNGWL